MSARPGTAGATRQCPHCKETILESATVCPACRHHLRYDESAAATAAATVTPLRIQGSIRQPADGGAWEYSVVLSILDDAGVEIARKLVGVGAMQPDERRTFTLTVEVAPAAGGAAGGKKRLTRH
ncbi:MAG TPA: hypothetical protein VFG21_01380 [Xanthomonadaceae bacterium]|nr:hypothetical protein [Xanthomonadaceae bacterium]